MFEQNPVRNMWLLGRKILQKIKISANNQSLRDQIELC